MWNIVFQFQIGMPIDKLILFGFESPMSFSNTFVPHHRYCSIHMIMCCFFYSYLFLLSPLFYKTEKFFYQNKRKVFSLFLGGWHNFISFAAKTSGYCFDLFWLFSVLDAAWRRTFLCTRVYVHCLCMCVCSSLCLCDFTFYLTPFTICLSVLRLMCGSLKCISEKKKWTRKIGKIFKLWRSFVQYLTVGPFWSHVSLFIVSFGCYLNFT